MSARVSPGNSSKKNVMGQASERRNNVGGRQQWMVAVEDSMRHGNAVTTQTTLVSIFSLSLFLCFFSLVMVAVTWHAYDKSESRTHVDWRPGARNLTTFSSTFVVTIPFTSRPHKIETIVPIRMRLRDLRAIESPA